MTPEDLQRRAEALAGSLVFLDEDAAAAEWTELGESFAALREEGAAWPVVADAASLGAELCGRLAADEVPDRAAGLEQLGLLATVLAGAAEDLQAGRSPRTFKAELAGVRVFLSDLQAGDAGGEAQGSPAGEEEEFRQVMLDRIDAVESSVLNLPDGAASPELLGEIFREFHTLKGETGILGLAELNEFFHRVESALERTRNEPVAVTGALVAALVRVNDVSRSLLEAGAVAAPEECDAAVRELAAAVEQSPLGEAAPAETEREEDDDFFAAMGAADSVAPAAAEASADAAAVAEAPVPPEEGFAPAPDGEAQPPAEEEPVPAGEAMQSVPVGVDRIDRLLDLVATTAATASQIAQHPALREAADTALNTDLMDLQRSVGGLQDLAVGLRMMPIRPLFRRLQRAAFNVSRSSHKGVDVEVIGADTEVDRSVIEQLTGALIHVVRNAIDHGIEPPAERREAGKPPRGRITLRAARRGPDIRIEVADDGRGLNRERIRQRAVEEGLVAPDAPLTDEDLESFIFRNGFSTARRVTGVSGRGVGMEAVRQAAAELRGKVSLETRPGTGTTLRLSLPLALAAIEGLVLGLGESRYVLPASAARESFRAAAADLKTIEGEGRVVAVRGTYLPVVDLGRALGLRPAAADLTAGVFVVTEHEGRLAALFVDEVLATQQVMVRPLEGPLAAVRQVSGTAALDGRRLALVLEARALLADASTRGARELDGARKKDGQIETVDLGGNQVGMVDFSLAYRQNGAVRRGRFAINAFKAREFVPVQELTRLPQAPRGFLGMLLLRGRTLPVVSLAQLLGFTEATEAGRGTILVCEFGSAVIGIQVTDVNRVHYISWDEIKPPPDSGGLVPVTYVVGTILMGEEVVMVLDFEQIVQDVLRLYKEFGDSLEDVEQRKEGSRVLLAEDSALVRRKIAEALRAANLEVIEAANGQEARDLLLEMAARVEEEGGSIFDLLDLVLSDIEMPQLDGYTLTRTVKTHPTLLGLPVILQSSLTNETVVQRAREVQADGVVGKHDPEELALQLRQYL
jgi:two-component system chemotaxis sensor kinase CheA